MSTEPGKRFPDFFCVGFQKCGTTWLNDNLRMHPQVYLPESKEVNYFAYVHLPQHRDWIDRQKINQIKSLMNWLDPEKPGGLETLERWAHQANAKHTDDWYSGIFSVAEPGALCGDISPSYAGLPQKGIEHVQRLSPNARILFMVRDPIERVVSHVAHVLSSWGKASPKTLELPTPKQVLSHPDVWAWSDYATAYKAWQSVFPGRVFVYDQDRLATDPKALLCEVCDNLGLDEAFDFRDAEKVVFRGSRPEGVDEVREIARRRLREPLSDFRKMFPEIGSKWEKAHYGELRASFSGALRRVSQRSTGYRTRS